MSFLYPELALLLAPGLFFWWRYRDPHPLTNVLRLLALLLLTFALCGFAWRTDVPGRDLVFVVDRSRSMPSSADATVHELIALAEESREAGDRVAVVGFGGESVVEQLPSSKARFSVFEREVFQDATDLASALETSLELIPRGRKGAIYVLSDGEVNGPDPRAWARRARARGIRIDVRPINRPPMGDLCVERLDLPLEVEESEAFQFAVWVWAEEEGPASFTIRRGDRVLSSGRRVFEAGRNRLLFRDVAGQAGVATYTVSLGNDQDRVPENNQGVGAVRVRGSRSVLVLNHDGRRDALCEALLSAGLKVVVSTPEAADLSAVGLTAYRCVVVQNVRADRIGFDRMRRLAQFVREGGGGLLMTGGEASFGVGGYHLSPIDEVLPVSMEMRQEYRKQAVSLAIVLDRSGSMQAPVGDDLRKMDLANLGASAAIELLSSMDEVTVIAVDSAPHIIQERTSLTDLGEVLNRVRTIDAGGGGIFVYTGLLAAGQQLEKAVPLNRHIILFADAADAEEQEKCPELLDAFGKMGITVSVIALGEDTDRDAEFLKDVAARGGGEVYFTQEPSELPRLFAQDTMAVAQSSFLKETTPMRITKDLIGLGEIPVQGFPSVDGFNITFLRRGALAGVVTAGDEPLPSFAFSYQGLGRSAALMAPIGGPYGGRVAAWPDFSTFVSSVVRWCGGQEEPEELFASVKREGRMAVVTLEIDPEQAHGLESARPVANLFRGKGEKVEARMDRVSEHVYRTRVPLDVQGVMLGTIRVDDQRFATLPPITLPYSPEFERHPDPDRGTKLLHRLARDTQGSVAPPANTLFRGEREGIARRLLTRELAVFALILLLVEIAGRRLGLWSLHPFAVMRRIWKRAMTKKKARANRESSATSREPKLAKRGDGPPREEASPVVEPRKDSVETALEKASRAAQRRLGR